METKKQNIIVQEDGTVYQLKKPFYKQGIFWGLLVSTSLFLFFLYSSFVLTTEVQKLEKEAILWEKIDEYGYAYLSRYIEEYPLRYTEAVSFALADVEEIPYGTEVLYDVGSLVVHSAKVDNSRKIDLDDNYYTSAVFVELEFNNTDEDITRLDVREFFAKVTDKTYPNVNTILSSDDDVEIDSADGYVYIDGNSVGKFTLVYTLNSELSESEPITFRHQNVIWK